MRDVKAFFQKNSLKVSNAKLRELMQVGSSSYCFTQLLSSMWKASQ